MAVASRYGTSMPSFDVVSKLDMAEVENGVANVMREVGQRYDFKGAHCSVEMTEEGLTILADDDLKLKQVHEILQGQMSKRKIDPRVLDYQTVEQAAGQSVRQKVLLKNGIATDLAKKLVKDIKAQKLKVQIAIQGEELRVTGKKRDDLQDVIAFLKTQELEQPLQYENFRD